MVIAFLKPSPFHHKFRPKADTFRIEGGEYNGYVAFDAELPKSWQSAKSLDIEEPLDSILDVHGGITFDESMEGIVNDVMIPLTAIPEPSVLKKMRVIGFDTLHYMDTREYWTLERTKEETLKLKKQIENLIANK